MRTAQRGGWFILATFAIGLLLDTAALQQPFDRLRPSFTTLILVYWCMMQPARVGIATGWAAGLLTDAARATLLGQHALSLALVAYLTLRTHRRLRLFPVWQQSLSVLVFVLTDQLLVAWIGAMLGHPPDDAWFLAPAASTLVIWPVLYMVLSRYGRHHHAT